MTEKRYTSKDVRVYRSSHQCHRLAALGPVPGPENNLDNPITYVPLSQYEALEERFTHQSLILVETAAFLERYRQRHTLNDISDTYDQR